MERGQILDQWDYRDPLQRNMVADDRYRIIQEDAVENFNYTRTIPPIYAPV